MQTKKTNKKAPRRETSASARRKRRNRRARRAAVMVAVIGILACVVLSLTVFFPITSVVVEGELSAYTPQQIIAAAGISKGDNLFAFSSAAVKGRLQTQMPYLEDVEISRSISGVITLTVTEATDFLVLPHQSGNLVLSPSLRVVGTSMESSGNLAKVYGLDPLDPKVGQPLQGAGEDGTLYLEYVVDALYENGLLAGVSDINVADKLNLSIVYENRLFIMLGTASNMDYKIRMMQQVVLNELKPEDTGYLDLSTAGKATFNPAQVELPDGYRSVAVIRNEPVTEES